MKQRTLAIIKTDAVQAGHTGEIISIIEKNGFHIGAIEKVCFCPEQIEQLYVEYKDNPFFDDLIGYMCWSFSIVLILYKDNAVEDFKTLKGATHPEKPAIGTLRHMFGTSVMKNAVHGSDTPEAAEREIALLFPKG